MDGADGCVVIGVFGKGKWFDRACVDVPHGPLCDPL